MSAVDVLVPTCGRPHAPAITLTALAAQTLPELRVSISDQSEPDSALDAPEVAAVLRVLHARGMSVLAQRHPAAPRHGRAARVPAVAGHRTLLPVRRRRRIRAEPRRTAARRDHRAAVRVRRQRAPWPELRRRRAATRAARRILGVDRDARGHRPGSPAWARHQLHSAANLYHAQRALQLDPAATRLYRVAWVGGCVLFDTAKLREVGGFDFWQELPPGTAARTCSRNCA